MKKIKAIKVVKLTEKERQKFSKQFKCNRCHDFFVDTKEELNQHMADLHGEYPEDVHRNYKAKGKSKGTHELYLNRNKMGVAKQQDVVLVKRIPIDCFAFRCKNCGKGGFIYDDMSKIKLQNYLQCPNCKANAFKDNRAEIINFAVKKGMKAWKFFGEYGIDISKFIGYKEVELKEMKNGSAMGKFMEKRKK